eukprot:7669759-Pyramimonas_sp.AAC.1
MSSRVVHRLIGRCLPAAIRPPEGQREAPPLSRSWMPSPRVVHRLIVVATCRPPIDRCCHVPSTDRSLLPYVVHRSIVVATCRPPIDRCRRVSSTD